MYSFFRHVPWSSLDEFLVVSKALSEKTSGSLREALEILHIWATRLPPSKVSRSVLCTHDLLVSYFEESHQSLALALMRLISLLSSEEQDRDKPYSAKSLNFLSEKAGFPPWIADLRNDVAHGSLPSIPVLDHAFSWALDRLIDFWNSNVVHMRASQMQLNDLFQSVCHEVDRYINERLSQSDPHAHFPLKLFEEAVSDIRLCTPIVRFTCSSLLHAQASSREIVSEPVIAVRRIRHLLSVLKQRRVLHDFILQFFLSVHSTDSSTSCCVAWCTYWLGAINAFPGDKHSTTNKYLDENSLRSFDWRRVFQHVIIEHSSPNLLKLCIGVLDSFRPCIPDCKQKNILSYLDVFFGVDDVALEGDSCHVNAAINSPWEYSEDMWADCVLGASHCSPDIRHYMLSPSACNAAPGRKHQGFSTQDPESGCKVGKNKGE